MVRTPGTRYRVHVGTGAFSKIGVPLGKLAVARVCVVTDENVARAWASRLIEELEFYGFHSHLVVLPPGEVHKDVATWARCIDGILAGGVDRDTPVLALGGGVVGDVAGFAAATVLRGVPYVQIPTTLLAMVDSSVGGKTAIDHPRGKNLIGVFQQPRMVWAGLETLTTLPDRERRAGLGEVLKTALLDRRLWARVERDAERLDAMDPETLADVVTACIRIKARIVEADERESGPRAVLNLGHTIAHGLEAACGYETLLHGEAVALGLVAEARWAVHSGVCDDDALPGRIASVAARMGLPARAPRVSASSLLAAMRLDKKVRQGILRLPVPIGPGQTAFVDLPFDRFHELVAEIP